MAKPQSVYGGTLQLPYRGTTPLFNADFIALIKLHSSIKAIDHSIKSVNRQMQVLVDDAESAIDMARDDYQYFGGFDDCGPSYEQALSRAEGRLSQVNAAKAQATRPLVASLKSMQQEYTQAKKQFVAKYGEAELAAFYQHNLHAGVVEHHRHLLASKSDKWRRYRIAQLLQFINGNDFVRSCAHERVSRPPALIISENQMTDSASISNAEKELHQYIVNTLAAITRVLDKTADGKFHHHDYCAVKKEWEASGLRGKCYRGHTVYGLARVAKRLVELDMELKSLYATKADQVFPIAGDYQSHLSF